MFAEYSDFDEVDRRIAAALYVPPYIVGTRAERACRMRDVLLTLMHAYHMPSLFYGYLAYDFGFFQASFAGPNPHDDNEAFPFHMLAWDDDDKVLDLRWDDGGAVKLRRYMPSWWERELDDIAFWDSRARWKSASPDLQPTVWGDDGEAPLGGNLMNLRSAFAALRPRAVAFAGSRMRSCYAAGDRKRGDKWASIVTAIDDAGSPATSSRLQ